MKALLICPGERCEVARLMEERPLALLPVLGKSLVAHWIEHLASLGAKEVRILASDRPEQVRAETGRGERWGVCVEVIPEIRELNPSSAREKYGAGQGEGWLPAPWGVAVLERLPSDPEHSLFSSYAAWYAGVRGALNRVGGFPRAGQRQVQPGVWVGRYASVAPSVRLLPPCWLGEHVVIGKEAVIGPDAVIEDRAMVEAGAQVQRTIVGPETFLSDGAHLSETIACGGVLTHWKTGVSIDVSDTYLLCSLRDEAMARACRVGWCARVAAMLLLMATLPLGVFLILWIWWMGDQAFRRVEAVRPRPVRSLAPLQPFAYYEFTRGRDLVRRWPQLWSIVKGDMTWVGNRPLRPAEAELLQNDFDRLWLATRVGLFSLADAEGCSDFMNETTRAHASFYSAMATWRLDVSILVRATIAAAGTPHMAKPIPLPTPERSAANNPPEMAGVTETL